MFILVVLLAFNPMNKQKNGSIAVGVRWFEQNFVTATTDELNNRSSFNCDSNGNLLDSTDASSRKWKLSLYSSECFRRQGIHRIEFYQSYPSCSPRFYCIGCISWIQSTFRRVYAEEEEAKGRVMNFHGFGGLVNKEQPLSMLHHLQRQWLLIYNPFTIDSDNPVTSCMASR